MVTQFCAIESGQIVMRDLPADAHIVGDAVYVRETRLGATNRAAAIDWLEAQESAICRAGSN